MTTTNNTLSKLVVNEIGQFVLYDGHKHTLSGGGRDRQFVLYDRRKHTLSDGYIKK